MKSKGEIKPAIACLEKAVMLEADFFDGWLELLKCYNKIENVEFKKKENVMKNLVRLKPDDSFYLVNLGDYYRNNDMFKLAFNIYIKALLDFTDYPNAIKSLICTLNIDEVIEHIADHYKELNLNENERQLPFNINLENFSNLLVNLELRFVNNEEDFIALYTLQVLYILDNELEKALRAFTLFLLVPGYQKIVIDAMMYANNEFLPDLVEIFSAQKKLVDKNPNIEHYVNISYNMCVHWGITEAIDCVNDAIKLFPNNPMILQAKAIVFLIFGDVEYSIELMEKALSIEPDNQEIKDMLKEAYRQMENLKYNIEVIDKKLNYHVSEEELKEILENDNLEKVKIHAGGIGPVNRDFYLHILRLEHALKANPDNIDIIFALVVKNYHLKNYFRSMFYGVRLIRKEPENPGTWWYLAQTYTRVHAGFAYNFAMKSRRLREKPEEIDVFLSLVERFRFAYWLSVKKGIARLI